MYYQCLLEETVANDRQRSLLPAVRDDIKDHLVGVSSRRRRLCRLAATRGEGTDHASEYSDDLISGDSTEDVDVAAISAVTFHAMTESTKVQRALIGRVMEYGPIYWRGM
jgi:hypothetical protein